MLLLISQISDIRKFSFWSIEKQIPKDFIECTINELEIIQNILLEF